MSTLYILGNGFDLYHGMKTSYTDFHRFVCENNNELETLLEDYFRLEVGEHSLWKNFEGDLRSFDHESFFENYNHIDVLSESFRRSECDSLEDELGEEAGSLVQSIRDGFTDWIDAVKYPEFGHVRERLLHFRPGSTFITFNYTDTLEVLYKVPKKDILYLHNNAGELEDLIFGHGELAEIDPEPEELDENGDSNRTLFTDARNTARSPFYTFQKDTGEVLKRHRLFFGKLKSITEVVVIGHSLGEVDWPYFRKIASLAPAARWKITCISEDDRQYKKELAGNMLGKLNMETIRMEDWR